MCGYLYPNPKGWLQMKILVVFTEAAPLGRFSHRVAMSVGGVAGLWVCAIECIFLGLSLALRSHDHFQASPWSSLAPPSMQDKKLLGAFLIKTVSIQMDWLSFITVILMASTLGSGASVTDHRMIYIYMHEFQCIHMNSWYNN